MIFRRDSFARLVRFLALCCALALPVCPDGASAGNKELVLYTALTATTPQIPLWAAVKTGWPKGRELRVEYWKNLDDLRGVILSGKGDVWIGHLEGFAQAALRGAPVTLVAVTGWKKFYFLAPKGTPETTMTALAETLRDQGLPLAVAPQDSPALGVLEAVRRNNGPSFTVAAMQPQQLMLEMLRGSRRYALVPEPFASSLLAKKSDLRVAASLEEEYARVFGGPARLPLAGVAVNTRLFTDDPDLVYGLISAMGEQADLLAPDKKTAADVLPPAVANALGREVLDASMDRDVIRSAPSWEVRQEITAFLRMVLAPKEQKDRDALETLLSGPFIPRERK